MEPDGYDPSIPTCKAGVFPISTMAPHFLYITSDTSTYIFNLVLRFPVFISLKERWRKERI